MKRAIQILAGAAAVALTTATQAQTVNFQWNSSEDGTVAVYNGPGVQGYGTGKFWNTIPGPSSWTPGLYSSTNSLADDGKTETGIILTLDTSGSMSCKAKPGSLSLFSSYADAFDSDPQVFTFTKVPDGAYNLVLFGANGSYRGNNITKYTVNGVTQSVTNHFNDSSFVEGVNYVVFKDIKVSGGKLKGTWAAGGSGDHPEGNLNGVQLQRVTSKESAAK